MIRGPSKYFLCMMCTITVNLCASSSMVSYLLLNDAYLAKILVEWTNKWQVLRDHHHKSYNNNNIFGYLLKAKAIFVCIPYTIYGWEWHQSSCLMFSSTIASSNYCSLLIIIIIVDKLSKIPMRAKQSKWNRNSFFLILFQFMWYLHLVFVSFLP